MSTDLQKQLKAKYTAISSHLTEYTAIQTAIIDLYSSSTNPTTSQKAAVIKSIADVVRNLPTNQITLSNDLNGLIDVLELDSVSNQLGNMPMPSTGNVEYGDYTFSSVVTDLQTGLADLDSSSTASDVASAIVAGIDAFNPSMTSEKLAEDISATVTANDVTSFALSQSIATSLTNLGAIADNASNGASLIETAVYDNLLSSNQISILADINSAEQYRDLAALKNGLVTAFGNGSVYTGNSADLSTAALAVFTDAGLSATTLTQYALKKDLDKTVSLAGAPTLGVLAQNIANKLISLSDQSLTASAIEDAVYSDVETGFLVQQDSIKADTTAAEVLYDYTVVKTALLSNLGGITSGSTAQEMTTAILDAYSSTPYAELSLTESELLADVQANIDVLSVNAADMASPMIAALNALDGTAGNEVTSDNLRLSIYNPEFYSVAMTNIYKDALATEESVNYNDVISGLTTALASTANTDTVDNFVAAVIAVYSGSELSSSSLNNDVTQTISTYSEATTALKLASLASAITTSLSSSPETSDGIKDALYSNLGFYDAGLMQADVTTAEGLLDNVVYKTNLIDAIEASDLFTNAAIASNTAVDTAIGDFGDAVYAALTKSGYSQTLTSAEIKKSFIAAYASKFGGSDYITDTVTYVEGTIPAYQAFAMGLVTSLNAVADNTITSGVIKSALFGTMIVNTSPSSVGSYYLIDPNTYNADQDLTVVESYIDLTLIRNSLVTNLDGKTTAVDIATGIRSALSSSLGVTSTLSLDQLEQDVIAGLTEVYGASYTTANVASFVTTMTTNLNAIPANTLTENLLEHAIFGTGLILQADKNQLANDAISIESLISYASVKEDLVTALTPLSADSGTTASTLATAIESVLGTANLSNSDLLADIEASVVYHTSRTAQNLATDLISALEALDDATLTSTVISNTMFGTIAPYDAHNFLTDAANAENYASLVANKNTLLSEINSVIATYSTSLSSVALANAILKGVHLTTVDFDSSNAERIALTNDIISSQGGSGTSYAIASAIVTALNGISVLTVDEIIGSVFATGRVTGTTSKGSSGDTVSGNSIYGDVNAIQALENLSGPYTLTNSVMYNLYNAVNGISFNSALSLATAITDSLNIGDATRLVQTLDLEDDIIATMTAQSKTADQVAAAIKTAVTTGIYAGNNNVEAIKSIIYGTNDTGNLAQDGPIIEAQVDLIVSGNPVDLSEDAIATEGLKDYLAVKDEIKSGLNTWDENLNANALAQHIIDGVNILGYSGDMSPSLSSLSSDIQSSLSGSVSTATVASAIYNALDALDDNALTASNIVSSIYGSGLISDSSFGDANTASLIETLDAVNADSNNFGPYTKSGSIIKAVYDALGGSFSYAATGASTVTDLATDITTAVNLIASPSTTNAAPEITVAELLADIKFTLSTSSDTSTTGVNDLADSIKTALVITDISAVGIRNAIYGNGLVESAGVDKTSLALDVAATSEGTENFVVIKNHISDALTGYSGTTATDLADVLIGAVRYISTASTVPGSDPSTWTPYPTPELNEDAFVRDIEASLPSEYTATNLQTLASSIKTAVDALGSTPTYSAIVNSIFAPSRIILGEYDEEVFEGDITTGMASHNSYATIVTQLQTNIGNAIFSGSTVNYLATSIVNAIEKISTSTYSNAAPIFTVAELEADIIASLAVFDSSGGSSLAGSIHTALTGVTTSSGIVNAIYNPSRVISANANEAALLSDLDSAIALTSSYDTVATAISSALDASFASDSDLTSAIQTAISTFVDNTSISLGLSSDDFIADVAASISGGDTVDALAARIKTVMDGLIANKETTPITAALIQEAIYNSARVISPNPASLATDLVSFAANTDSFETVAGQLKTALDTQGANNAATDTTLANAIGGVWTPPADVSPTELIADLASHAGTAKAFSAILANNFATLPSTAGGIVSGLYGLAATGIVSVDSTNLNADLESYQNDSNSFAPLVTQLTTALGGEGSYTGVTSTDLATSIINAITTDATARTNVGLKIVTLAGDIEISLGSGTIADLAAEVKAALVGATSATAIQEAIYHDGRILATGSDEAALLADINATKAVMKTAGTNFNAIGVALYDALDAGTYATANELAVAIRDTVDTISVGNAFTGSLSVDNLEADITSSLSGNGSVEVQVSALKALLVTSLSSFAGITAASVRDGLYGSSLITAANPINMEADIASSEAVDNQVTVSSVMGGNSFSTAANAGGLDGTITGLVGNNAMCGASSTHSFYACTKDAITGAMTVGAAVSTFDCTVTGVVPYIASCALWSAASGDLYGSYTNSDSGCSSDMLGAQALQTCLLGMNYEVA